MAIAVGNLGYFEAWLWTGNFLFLFSRAFLGWMSVSWFERYFCVIRTSVNLLFVDLILFPAFFFFFLFDCFLHWKCIIRSAYVPTPSYTSSLDPPPFSSLFCSKYALLLFTPGHWPPLLSFRRGSQPEDNCRPTVADTQSTDSSLKKIMSQRNLIPLASCIYSQGHNIS